MFYQMRYPTDLPLLHHNVHICGLERNVSKTIEQIDVIFGTDIYVPFRMTCNNFGDALAI